MTLICLLKILVGVSDINCTPNNEERYISVAKCVCIGPSTSEEDKEGEGEEDKEGEEDEKK